MYSLFCPDGLDYTIDEQLKFLDMSLEEMTEFKAIETEYRIKNNGLSPYRFWKDMEMEVFYDKYMFMEYLMSNDDDNWYFMRFYEIWRWDCLLPMRPVILPSELAGYQEMATWDEFFDEGITEPEEESTFSIDHIVDIAMNLFFFYKIIDIFQTDYD